MAKDARESKRGKAVWKPRQKYPVGRESSNEGINTEASSPKHYVVMPGLFAEKRKNLQWRMDGFAMAHRRTHGRN